MPMPDFASVDAYLAALPPAAQKRLVHLRAVVRKAVPGLVESVTYKIPTYKLDGTAVVFFSAWKEHFSFYPATDASLEAVPALAKFKKGRGTLQIPYDAEISDALVTKLTKARAAEVRAELAKKPAKKKLAKKKR